MYAAGTHIDEIESALCGSAAVRRDAEVVASWRRCVEQHGLDPARAMPAYIVPEGKFREHREQSERIVRIARSGLQDLFRQVAGQRYVLLLADKQGVTVDFLGDASAERALREAGLYLGAMWAEETAGTNGVGCTLATGRPTVIHQTDHFDLTHTGLSCTAAPIFDTDGVLQAVLDISLLQSPTPKASQRLAAHLVGRTVRRIELANMMATMREHWVLRLAHSPDFLDVDPEAAVALDASGRIVGTTHEALRMLGKARDVDWRTPGAVIGQPLARFLDLSVDDLPAFIAGRPTEDRLVHLRDGSALFGHAIAPVDRSPRRVRPRPELPPPLEALAGADTAMQAVQSKAARLARGPLSILLRGETGVGKERFARAIHAARARPGPFVPINCAALPESLIEGELFGHAPGAFSGALSRGRPGLIEAADGGVLFLDEIGDMPYPLQARLLRVLSEGAVTRLGEHTPRPVDLKVVSATHRDLPTLVARGAFRADLYYRLAAATLVIPPLRERADLGWLIDRLVRERAAVYERSARLSPDARRELLSRPWPGNVRQLINVLDVALALADGPVLERRHLEGCDVAEPHLMRQVPSEPDADDAGATLLAVLQRWNWNITRAADELGVDRTTVHRRLRRLGLSRPD